jgi:hypothetical protein
VDARPGGRWGGESGRWGGGSTAVAGHITPRKGDGDPPMFTRRCWSVEGSHDADAVAEGIPAPRRRLSTRCRRALWAMQLASLSHDKVRGGSASPLTGCGVHCHSLLVGQLDNHVDNIRTNCSLPQAGPKREGKGR